MGCTYYPKDMGDGKRLFERGKYSLAVANNHVSMMQNYHALRSEVEKMTYTEYIRGGHYERLASGAIQKMDESPETP